MAASIKKLRQTMSNLANQLQIMLKLQDEMNSKVHPAWREQGFAWFRALWIECAELIDHYGYKWWKKQQPDMQQVQLEVVDIWHFGLSMRIDGRDFSVIAEEMAAEITAYQRQNLGVIEASEQLVANVLVKNQFHAGEFVELMQAAELDMDSLFKQYVGKNILNRFRQDNGYQEGSYIKTWHQREDNEHLSELLHSLPVNENFAEAVYQALQTIYQTVKQ